MENPSQNLLAPDAPIVALLSLGANPLLTSMSTEELKAHLARVKSLAQQPATLNSQLLKEDKKPRSGAAAAKRKEILDSL